MIQFCFYVKYPPADTVKQGVYEGFCFKLINTLKEIYNFT